MANSMTLAVPMTLYAKSDTETSYFTDKASVAFNFDLCNWESGIIDAFGVCRIRIDADKLWPPLATPLSQKSG